MKIIVNYASAEYDAMVSLVSNLTYLYLCRTRLLRANLLQPLKDIETINARLDCLVIFSIIHLKNLEHDSWISFFSRATYFKSILLHQK